MNYFNKKQLVSAILAALVLWPYHSSATSKELSKLISDKSCALSAMSVKSAASLYNHFFRYEKSRKDILGFQQKLMEQPWCTTDCPHEIFHSFADGMYKREMHIKAGHIIIGEIHRNEYFVNVSKGRIWLTSEFYNKELIAPCSFTAPAGTKHIGYTLEDTVWTDTHKVTSTDISQAEKEIFVSSYEELDKGNKIINAEYENMCKDINLDEKYIRLASEIETDMIELSDEYKENIEVKNSDIEGVGVFSLKGLSIGEIIGDARVESNRTILGRYINHSDDPNAQAKIIGNKAVVIAIKDISHNEEITMDYRVNIKLSGLLDRGDV